MTTGFKTQQHGHVFAFCPAVIISSVQLSTSKVQQGNSIVRRHEDVALMQIAVANTALMDSVKNC